MHHLPTVVAKKERKIPHQQSPTFRISDLQSYLNRWQIISKLEALHELPRWCWIQHRHDRRHRTIALYLLTDISYISLGLSAAPCSILTFSDLMEVFWRNFSISFKSCYDKYQRCFYHVLAPFWKLSSLMVPMSQCAHKRNLARRGWKEAQSKNRIIIIIIVCSRLQQFLGIKESR